MTEIRIGKGKDGLAVVYNGNHCQSDFFSIEERYTAYMAAVKILETELVELAGSNLPFKNYFWCFTPVTVRHEGPYGILEWHYLMEILKKTIEKYEPVEVTIDLKIPEYYKAKILNFLSCKKLLVKYNGESLRGIAVFIKKSLRKCKSIASNQVMLAKMIGESVSIIKRKEKTYSNVDVLLRSNSKTNNTAYGDLFAFFEERGIASEIFDTTLFNERKLNRDNSITNGISFYGTLYTVIKALFLKTVSYFASAFYKENTVAAMLLGTPLYHYYDLILFENSISRWIKHCNPTVVFNTGIFNNPKIRLLNRICRQNDIKRITVFPRTISPDKTEERLIAPDMECTETPLSDYFIVRDKYSKEIVTGYGIEQQRIYLGSKTISPLSKKKINLQTALHILLLFQDHYKKELLLNAIDSIKLPTNYKLLVRAHPDYPLTHQNKKILDNINPNWEDMTGLPFKTLEGKNTIAIAISSTSVIDAAQVCATVVWAPFLSGEQFLSTYSLMKEIGVICENKKQLKDYIHRHSTLNPTELTSNSKNIKQTNKKFGCANLVSEAYSNTGLVNGMNLISDIGIK